MYGPTAEQILEECQRGEGVDTSIFRECLTKPVIPDVFFHEFFFVSYGLSNIGDHPITQSSIDKQTQMYDIIKPNNIYKVEESYSDLILSQENHVTNKLHAPMSLLNMYLVLDTLKILPFPVHFRQQLSLQISKIAGFKSSSQNLCLSPAQQIQLNKLQRDYCKEKMILQCLNEALCSWRPYAVKGEPLAGMCHFGRLNKVRIQTSEMKYIFSVTINKLMESVFLLCGVLAERETLLQNRWNATAMSRQQRKLLECLLGGGPNGDPADALLFSNELLNKLREDKLVRFLNWDIYETDDKWLFYDFEVLETQVHLDTLLFDFLLEDLAYDFLIH